MKKYSIGLIILISCFSRIHAKSDWAKSNNENLVGSLYTVSCYGEGPALDIARHQAKNDCLIAASRQVNSTYKIKTLSVETETYAGLHQEVESNSRITGLICIPKKEDIEELGSQFKVWIQCEFNLSKIKIENALQENETTKATASIKSSEKEILSIYSVPKCTSIIIEGKKPRILPCNHNPISIVTMPEDKTILIRADGYRPKTINLSELVNRKDSIRVILEGN